MRYYLILFSCSVFMACPASLQDFIEVPLTDADIATGLKEALNLGTDEAVDALSIKDGYYKSLYKILLPEEARVVTDKLKVIPGFSNIEEVAVEKVNNIRKPVIKTTTPSKASGPAMRARRIIG